MAKRKTFIRFFTIADYNEEEIWLRDQHRSGWKLVKMIPPCFFIFEECRPEDVIYRLDFKNNAQNPEYMQMLADFGWDYCGKCVGWLYFRKPASAVVYEEDGELFSDNASRLEMVEHLFKMRLFPLLIIFLCAVVPNLIRSLDSGMSAFLTGMCGTLFVVYVFLLVYCSMKLKRIKRNLTW